MRVISPNIFTIICGKICTIFLYKICIFDFEKIPADTGNIKNSKKLNKMSKNSIPNGYKANYLFDTAKLIQRPIPEQRGFEIEYYELLNSLPEKINEAFELTNKAKRKKRPLSINRNWFPNEMSGNVLDLVAQSFPHLVQATGRGSYCLMLNFKYECYIKKLTNKKLSPVYNHSKTSRRLTNQQAKEKIEAPIPVIYMGWTINKTNEKITGYYAVCRKGEDRIWYSDLTSIELPQIKNIEVEQTKSTPSKVVVKLKDKRKAK